MLTYLADVSLRSMLLALVAAAIVIPARRRLSAAMQHAIWTAVVGGMLALFALSAGLPRLSLPVLQPASASTTAVRAVSGDLPAFDDAAPLVEMRSAAASVRIRSIDWAVIAVCAYSAVALALLAQLIAGTFLVRRLRAQSTRCPGMQGVYESASISVPMTVELLRPSILLPLEWRQWESAKLDAVLAHEGAHVRRHDGFAAALAALNRSIFWFHPLAWMLERKLALLAEQACDECCVSVLGDSRGYALLLIEMALTAGEAGGRLRCHALTMAARSNIRQRIDALLEDGRTFSRGLSRRGLIGVALCSLIAASAAGAIDVGQQTPLLSLDLPRWSAPSAPALLVQAKPAPPQTAPVPKFDAVSVKRCDPSSVPEGGRSGGSVRWTPGRFTMVCGDVENFILNAYIIYPQQPVKAARLIPILRAHPVEGGPEWVRSERYTIEATEAGTPSPDNMRGPMLQAILEDRFKLRVHREGRQMPAYELTVAKGGFKLHPAEEGSCVERPHLDRPPAMILPPVPGQNPFCGQSSIKADQSNMSADLRSMTLDQLANWLTLGSDRPVTDKTSIEGRYDFELQYSHKERALDAPDNSDDVLYPSLATALEQFGLRLTNSKAPLDYVIIDHVERPSGN